MYTVPAAMPYNRLPFFSDDLEFLEIGMFLRLPLSRLHKIGAELGKLCEEHGVEYSISSSTKAVQIKGQARLNFFLPNGPCHRWLDSTGEDVKEFVTRPSLLDPRNLLISPKIVVGVIQLSSVFKTAADSARKSGNPVLVCYHFAKGEADWGGTQCPLPYTMVRAGIPPL